VRRRNRDAQDILRGLRSLGSTRLPGTKQLDPSLGYHHVFFFGDLNYRLDESLDKVIEVRDVLLTVDRD